MADQQDQRKSARVPVEISASFSKDGEIVKGSILNLSADGIFVQTSHLLNENESVTVKFELPGLIEMNLTGKVVWSKRLEDTVMPASGMGIHFEQIDAAQSDELKKFINKVLQQS